MVSQNILIIGGGQIGTSLAAALLANQAEFRITILDRDLSVEAGIRTKLMELGVAVEKLKFTCNPSEVGDCDIMVLATPIGVFGAAIAACRPVFQNNQDMVVTDVGSVKGAPAQSVLAAIKDIGFSNEYVGFHVSNGNSGSGAITAGWIFRDAPGIIVKGNASNVAFSKAQEFWGKTGVHLIEMSAEQHDQVFGTISHLEHVIVFALMQTDFIENLCHCRAVVDAGNWLAALTRIAKSGPDMWADIFTANGVAILQSAKRFKTNLGAVSYLADLNNTLGILHDYTRAKPSQRMGRLDIDSLSDDSVGVSARIAMLSVAIAQNVFATEVCTGFDVMSVLNPSCKDGLGAVAIDPSGAQHVLMQKIAELPAFAADFLREFGKVTTAIASRDADFIRDLVAASGEKLGQLQLALAKPQAAVTAAAAVHRL